MYKNIFSSKQKIHQKTMYKEMQNFFSSDQGNKNTVPQKKAKAETMLKKKSSKKLQIFYRNKNVYCSISKNYVAFNTSEINAI